VIELLNGQRAITFSWHQRGSCFDCFLRSMITETKQSACISVTDTVQQDSLTYAWQSGKTGVMRQMESLRFESARPLHSFMRYVQLMELAARKDEQVGWKHYQMCNWQLGKTGNTKHRQATSARTQETAGTFPRTVKAGRDCNV